MLHTTASHQRRVLNFVHKPGAHRAACEACDGADDAGRLHDCANDGGVEQLHQRGCGRRLQRGSPLKDACLARQRLLVGEAHRQAGLHVQGSSRVQGVGFGDLGGRSRLKPPESPLAAGLQVLSPSCRVQVQSELLAPAAAWQAGGCSGSGGSLHSWHAARACSTSAGQVHAVACACAGLGPAPGLPTLISATDLSQCCWAQAPSSPGQSKSVSEP